MPRTVCVLSCFSVNQGLAALAFVGVEVNLVLFSTRVLKQTNAEAANTFSRWMGTVNLFSLIGAFLSDSYLGRYLTCAIFQVVFTLGLAMLSISTYFFLLKPHGCGKVGFLCDPHSSLEMAIFYMSIYLIALGNGAYEPSLATLGADQFDEEDANEKRSKTSFFSYFYVALNLGSMFSETVLAYIQNLGNWVLGFWISTGCGFIAFGLFLSGTLRYRHFKPSGNPLSRFSQVIVASIKKMKLEVPSNGDGLYELHGSASTTNVGERKILHTDDFKFLDRAAIITSDDMTSMIPNKSDPPNPWQLCTVTQVEEVKCVLRLLPIWLCTIFYSVVFIQMVSLFVEQGAAMKTTLHTFHIPPASMTVFDIISISTFIILYDKFILPFFQKLTKNKPKEPSELQRMGYGLVFAIIAMVSAGLVEIQRLKYAKEDLQELSSLSIFWQIPQYVLIGVSEAFMYVAQLEFFAAQTPDSLKSLGIGLCMSSTAMGSYLCSILLTVVMEITSKNGQPGWIPPNLNDGHMDRFFFLSAGITVVNLVAYILCAKSVETSPISRILTVDEILKSPDRAELSRPLPPLFGSVKPNPKLGAALAAAAAASRSIPTPHAATIKSRRERKSLQIENFGSLVGDSEIRFDDSANLNAVAYLEDASNGVGSGITQLDRKFGEEDVKVENFVSSSVKTVVDIIIKMPLEDMRLRRFHLREMKYLLL
ncbi:Proton-dependent oligopeptide transporter family [Macleaya cordata]|uniref:Proton-dependent oligopeptide transporter family n=1 Tax=Macleaya cordata TaxID=56857 RepID=A0A200R9Z7_MACCD|nr:Proton-dependent oligopeptide transporter family [Macleaya cordata]